MNLVLLNQEKKLRASKGFVIIAAFRIDLKHVVPNAHTDTTFVG